MKLVGLDGSVNMKHEFPFISMIATSAMVGMLPGSRESIGKCNMGSFSSQIDLQNSNHSNLL